MATDSNHSIIRTSVLTLLALLAFAANSVLCRMALGEESIDAASFTAIRLLSGALILLLILKLATRSSSEPPKANWKSALMLFTYAICFSYAYITLDTGTGALILFGSVQVSMIMISLWSGNRLHLSEWIGVIVAFAGFVYLVSPGVSAPSPAGFILMAAAGIAWGIYTLRGRGSENPLADTSGNFVRCLPLVVVLVILTYSQADLSGRGIVLAILSGAVASGLGYTIWYHALTGLGATLAAVVQLTVPVIAALGGVVFVGESISLRLLLSSIMILGGILLVILGRYYLMQKKADNTIEKTTD